MMSFRKKLASSLAAILSVFATAVVAQTNPSPAVEKYSEEGQKALAQGRYDEAERAYEKLRELSPKTAEVHANLGLIYFNERKFDRAVVALREGLKLNPNLRKTSVLLAMSLSELGQYDEALPVLEKELPVWKFCVSRSQEVGRCGAQIGLETPSLR